MAMEDVVFENEFIRVTRVTILPGIKHVPSGPRGDRLGGVLNDQRRHRSHDGDSEVRGRSAGDVVWHEASAGHEITNSGEHVMHSLVIEPKVQKP